MDCIVDHITDGHAVDRADMNINHGSNMQVWKTTIGGTCALSGRTEPQVGNVFQISRNAIPWKLLNMPLARNSKMNLILYGGCNMSSISGTKS
jgi:hypothetical protein